MRPDLTEASLEIGREASDATKPGDEPGSVRAAFSACSNV